MTKLEEERVKQLLHKIVEHYEKEDRAARDRQIRNWKRLKYVWDGINQVWFSEVAHDWRVYEPDQYNDDTDQSYYDKPINVFRAYLESIIAALSITVPPIKCYPDDANNSLDLSTASAGDEIAKLVYQHNNAPLIWIKALYIFCTEGLIAWYNYADKDKKYGTYEKKSYEEVTETHQITSCPNCGMEVDDQLINQFEDKFNPDDADVPLMDALGEYEDLCPACMSVVNMQIRNKELIVTRLSGVTHEPKTRQCIQPWGGLYVKVPIYARSQKGCHYLFYYYEDDYANIIEEYEDLADVLRSSSNTVQGGLYNQYEAWGRLSTQYRGEMPINNRTVRNCWLRPSTFNYLSDEDDIKFLKKHFPDGCKVVFINDQFAEACNQCLDDHWTITYNPLSDSVFYDPIGNLLTSVQDITNDLISLTLQTIEHGIGQTFFDPQVLNAQAYNNTEVLPGGMYPATPKSGKGMGDAFYQVKTATLSSEVMPFGEKIQSLGQLAVGALPSLFGGALEESNTASEYSMSRAQALQRLQNTWKMLTSTWKEVFAKVITQYIECAVEDEKIVQRDQFGGFVNSFIRLAELEGKIGKVELEANENLPITWNQKKDVIMQLLQAGNPEILALLGAPENLPIIKDAIGLNEFYVTGEDDRIKQYEEIQQLLEGAPSEIPSQPMGMGPMGPIMSPPQEIPSIQIDPEVDNHQVQFEICRAWAVSTAGRIAKLENPEGYKNVLLHAVMHQQAMMQSMAPQGDGSNPEKPNEDTQTPIQQESDVNVQQ